MTNSVIKHSYVIYCLNIVKLLKHGNCYNLLLITQLINRVLRRKYIFMGSARRILTDSFCTVATFSSEENGGNQRKPLLAGSMFFTILILSRSIFHTLPSLLKKYGGFPHVFKCWGFCYIRLLFWNFLISDSCFLNGIWVEKACVCVVWATWYSFRSWDAGILFEEMPERNAVSWNDDDK